MTQKRDFGTLLSPLLVLSLLVVWELGARLLSVPVWLLPPPSEIVVSLWTSRELLLTHSLVTLIEVLIGFGASVVIGFGLAVAIARSRVIERAIYPLVVASQTIPVAAIAPLLLIWFGYGIGPKAMVVALVCFFSIVVNTVDGFRSVDPELKNLLRTMGASPRQVFFKVELPAALPSLLSGTKIAAAVAVIGAVIGEWVGAQAGLGYLMVRSVAQFQTSRVFAAVIVLSLMGILLFGLVSWIERSVTGYRKTAA